MSVLVSAGLCGSSPASRHLDQWQLTFDGNYQSSHFAKNCDKEDTSVFAGTAHFEEARKFEGQIQRAKGRMGADTAVSSNIHYF